MALGTDGIYETINNIEYWTGVKVPLMGIPQDVCNRIKFHRMCVTGYMGELKSYQVQICDFSPQDKPVEDKMATRVRSLSVFALHDKVKTSSSRLMRFNNAYHKLICEMASRVFGSALNSKFAATIQIHG